ncbi:hypothetical protein [Metamycoplasma canadense]|uniref:hypothetical protein n=1 Tax=Metamycoplasma canadense TaxID=29554 RepID=UPI0005EE2440|nr:hypothetical protein [Metamycoplasma canadense]
MNYKNFSELANKNKSKRIAKKVVNALGILFVVIVGLVAVGFIIYGLIIGVSKIFTQDTLNLFS